jgi:hypothetical protein
MTAVAQDTLTALLPKFGALSKYSRNFSGDLMGNNTAALNVNLFAATTGAEYDQNSTTYAVTDIASSSVTVTPTELYAHQVWNGVNQSGTPVDIVANLIPIQASAVAAAAFAKMGALVTVANYAGELISTAANFDADDLADLQSRLDTAQVNESGRVAVLKPTYTRYLSADNAIQATYASGTSSVIQQGILPNIHGFDIAKVTGTIPANAQSLEGWVSGPEAFALAARMPTPDGLAGVQIGSAVDPDTGLPLQVRFWRDANTGLFHLWTGMMFGIAKGNGATLIRIRSA